MTLNICDGEKQKKNKTKILRRDTLLISGAVVPRCNVRKVCLKVWPLVYSQVIKIHIK